MNLIAIKRGITFRETVIFRKGNWEFVAEEVSDAGKFKAVHLFLIYHGNRKIVSSH